MMRMAERFGFTRRDPVFWGGWGLLLVAFSGLALWAHRSDALPFDDRSSHWLEHHHHFFPYSDPFWRYLGDTGTVPVIVALVVVIAGVLLLRGARVESVLVAAVLPFAMIQIGVRALVDRPAISAPAPGRQYPLESSFPSGHAFGEFMVFGLLFAFVPLIVPGRVATIAVRVACVLLIVFGGLERMVDVAHWPSDVLGADMLALLYVAPAAWIGLKLRGRAALDAEVAHWSR